MKSKNALTRVYGTPDFDTLIQLKKRAKSKRMSLSSYISDFLTSSVSQEPGNGKSENLFFDPIGSVCLESTDSARRDAYKEKQQWLKNRT